jgi:hypothetical protein
MGVACFSETTIKIFSAIKTLKLIHDTHEAVSHWLRFKLGTSE